ncbi:hypothetical protein ILUMI_12539, partial [Ignelater luminosus]
ILLGIIRMESNNSEETKLNDEIDRIIGKEISSKFCEKYVMIVKDRTVLLSLYLQHAEEIKNFEVYDDDVWVLSYPKAGKSTVVAARKVADIDCSKLKIKKLVNFRFCSVIDRVKIYEELNIPTLKYEANSIDFAKNMQRPRFIKTHLPFSLLPEQIQNGTKSPKMICTIRNPKDACVSDYHYGSLALSWQTSLENFAKVFMAERRKMIYFSFIYIYIFQI